MAYGHHCWLPAPQWSRYAYGVHSPPDTRRMCPCPLVQSCAQPLAFSDSPSNFRVRRLTSVIAIVISDSLQERFRLIAATRASRICLRTSFSLSESIVMAFSLRNLETRQSNQHSP